MLSVRVAVVVGPPASASRDSQPSWRGARGTLLCSGAAASRTATASRTGRCARSSSKRSRGGARRRARGARRGHTSAGARDRMDLPAVLRVARGGQAAGSRLRRRPLGGADIRRAGSSCSPTAVRGGSSWSAWRGTTCSKTDHRSSRIEERRAHRAGCRSRPRTPMLSWTGSAARSWVGSEGAYPRDGGGNPFFVEQLLAVALEGGLAEQTLPETVQALLAARLERLGPGERAVLGARVDRTEGVHARRRCRAPRPGAVPTVGTHLETLVGRGFSGRPRTLSASAMSSFRTRCTARRRSACVRSCTSASRIVSTDDRGARRARRIRRLPPRASDLLRIDLGESDRRTRTTCRGCGSPVGPGRNPGLETRRCSGCGCLLQRAAGIVFAASSLAADLQLELG